MKFLYSLALLACVSLQAHADHLPQQAPSASQWIPSASVMSDTRWAPAGATLADGATGLILGGYSYDLDRCVATTDIFSEVVHRFRPAKGRLTIPRDFAAASLLPGGQVLVTGGYNTVLGSLAAAELYNPVTENFTLLSSRFSVGRELFTATALPDGRILYAGGLSLARRGTQRSADLFDPKTMTFQETGNLMAQDRFGHAAVCLGDGRVLIVGGTSWRIGRPAKTLATAEIFDLHTGLFHPAHGEMSFARDRPTATLLPGGDVLIAGGQVGGNGVTPAELFDPKSETFRTLQARLHTPRMAHSALTLPDGRVLLAGGWSSPAQATTATTEIFDPRTLSFSDGPSMPTGSHDNVLLLFSDGDVLAAGGKSVENGKEFSLNTGAEWNSGVAIR